jgi:hypothetical protein
VIATHLARNMTWLSQQLTEWNDGTSKKSRCLCAFHDVISSKISLPVSYSGALDDDESGDNAGIISRPGTEFAVL